MLWEVKEMHCHVLVFQNTKDFKSNHFKLYGTTNELAPLVGDWDDF